MLSYDFKRPSSRLETENNNAENASATTDGTKLNIHPKVSSNRNVSKFNINTFAGTTEEWNSITKGSYWNDGVSATYVQCSDGQVTL